MNEVSHTEPLKRGTSFFSNLLHYNNITSFPRALHNILSIQITFQVYKMSTYSLHIKKHISVSSFMVGFSTGCFQFIYWYKGLRVLSKQKGTKTELIREEGQGFYACSIFECRSGKRYNVFKMIMTLIQST